MIFNIFFKFCFENGFYIFSCNLIFHSNVDSAAEIKALKSRINCLVITYVIYQLTTAEVMIVILLPGLCDSAPATPRCGAAAKRLGHDGELIGR